MERVLQSFKRPDVPKELLAGPSVPTLFFYVFFDWAIIIAASILMLNTTAYLYPLWVIIIAGRLHGLGVVLHELCHMNTNKKTFSVRILEVLSGYIIGSSANAMAYHHIPHHRNTLRDNDPYYKINKKCTGLRRFFLSITKGMFFVPFWLTRTIVAPFALMFAKVRTPYARIFMQDVSKTDLSQSREVILCAKEDIPILLFHLLLLYLTITKFEFLIYCYYLVIPVAGIFCIYRLLIEHEYDIVENKSTYSMIECTFDHHTNLIERCFIGPHHIGHHCMHHIHPKAGLHVLPKLKKWYLENSKQYQRKYLAPQRPTWKEELFGGIHKN